MKHNVGQRLSSTCVRTRRSACSAFLAVPFRAFALRSGPSILSYSRDGRQTPWQYRLCNGGAHSASSALAARSLAAHSKSKRSHLEPPLSVHGIGLSRFRRYGYSTCESARAGNAQ
eukprot:3130881-Pleurochrysis_carterae.AAC.5